MGNPNLLKNNLIFLDIILFFFSILIKVSVKTQTKTIFHGGYMIKAKECNSQEKLYKLARLGIGLATATALGSLVTTHSPLLESVVVEAQEVSGQTNTEQVLPSQEVQEVPEQTSTEQVSPSQEAQEVKDQTSTEQVSPVNQEAKTVMFILNSEYDEMGRNEVTLQPGETYTISVDESKYVIAFDQKKIYSYDEIEDGATYYLFLEPKAQVNEDQSISFEVVTKVRTYSAGGVGDSPIEHKVFTLKMGESITLAPPIYEDFIHEAEFDAWLKREISSDTNYKSDYVPQIITNDGKSGINGQYDLYYHQKRLDIPVAPADYVNEVFPALDKPSALRVDHYINENYKYLIYYSVPANGSIAPLLLANPNFGQLSNYELDKNYNVYSNVMSKRLNLHYRYPEEQLPGGTIHRLPIALGVWDVPVTPAPNSNTTDTPTTPTEEPKQPEIPTPEDKQAKDLTSGNNAVSVRVFGSDVATVDKIIANKETDSTVLATLPTGYPAQDADLYDIKTLDTTGQFVQIGGEAQVTLPVAPDRVVEKVIYFLPSTGAVEELPFEWDKATNTVSFKVSHFSHYGIIYQPVKNPNPNPTPPAGQVTPNSQTKPASPQVPPTVTPQNLTVTPVTPQATSQTLPKTGEASSLMTAVGLDLASLALALRSRRQKR